jgi:hypothetical protein
VKQDNRLYGHDHVLARYCGLPHPRAIRGVIQHGWHPTFGLHYQGKPQPTAGLPRLVWNRRNLHCNLDLGYRNTVAIGAPFLYHEHADATPEAGSLLVCPMHGWEEARLIGSHEAYLEELERIRAGFDRISVCLYWLEYEDRAIRDLYAGAGYEVITNGHRDENPNFIATLSDHLTRHEYVTSSRIATIAFCALYLRRKFFLHGRAMTVADESEETLRRSLEFQNDAFGALTYERFGDRCHAEIGDRELGAEFRRTPSELHRILGWNLGGLPVKLASLRLLLTPRRWL